MMLIRLIQSQFAGHLTTESRQQTALLARAVRQLVCLTAREAEFVWRQIELPNPDLEDRTTEPPTRPAIVWFRMLEPNPLINRFVIADVLQVQSRALHIPKVGLVADAGKGFARALV